MPVGATWSQAARHTVLLITLKYEVKQKQIWPESAADWIFRIQKTFQVEKKHDFPRADSNVISDLTSREKQVIAVGDWGPFQSLELTAQCNKHKLLHFTLVESTDTFSGTWLHFHLKNSRLHKLKPLAPKILALTKTSGPTCGQLWYEGVIFLLCGGPPTRPVLL